MTESMPVPALCAAAPDHGAPATDQAIRDFMAPRSDAYLRHYERQRRRATAIDPDGANLRYPFAPSWLWPAFFITVPWMFYRKMYSGGIILVALPVFLDHILPGSLFLGSGILVALIAGLCGKSWYVDHATGRLAKAQRLYACERERRAYIDRARGVSIAGGIFGVMIQSVVATVVVLDLLPPALS